MLINSIFLKWQNRSNDISSWKCFVYKLNWIIQFGRGRFLSLFLMISNKLSSFWEKGDINEILLCLEELSIFSNDFELFFLSLIAMFHNDLGKTDNFFSFILYMFHYHYIQGDSRWTVIDLTENGTQDSFENSVIGGLRRCPFDFKYS